MSEHLASQSTDGVRVTRRVALHGTWALPATWALCGWSQARGQDPTGARGAVDAFLREWTERGEALVAQSDPNEDAHLHELCAGLARLEPGAFPPRALDAFAGMGMTTGPVHQEASFLVVELELEPGAVVRAHNHVGWAFATLGAAGEAVGRHFEAEKDAPAPTEVGVDFRVREVSSTLLRPGRTTTLTRTRANIHWFQAGEDGATLLDFGVRFPDPGDGPQAFSVMEFDPEPADPARRIHVARWIGNPYTEKKG